MASFWSRIKKVHVHWSGYNRSGKLKYKCYKEPSHNRFQLGVNITTAMDSNIEYDSKGRVIKPDLNAQSGSYNCLDCGTVYETVQQGWNKDIYCSDDLMESIDLTPDYMKGGK